MQLETTKERVSILKSALACFGIAVIASTGVVAEDMLNPDIQLGNTQYTEYEYRQLRPILTASFEENQDNPIWFFYEQGQMWADMVNREMSRQKETIETDDYTKIKTEANEIVKKAIK